MRLAALALFCFFCQSGYALDCDNPYTMDNAKKCAMGEQSKIEAELNEKFHQVLESVRSTVDDLPPAEKRKDMDVSRTLIAAQKAWEKYRAADCRARYARDIERSIAPILQINCMRDHASQRIKDLERYEQP